MTRTAIALSAVKTATYAIQLKERVASVALRRAVVKDVHVKQVNRAEKDLQAVLNPWLKAQIDNAVDNLEKLSTLPKNADKIFGNVDEWHVKLVNAVLPVLVKNMGRAAVAQLMAMGIDPRKSGVFVVKASTATDWLESIGEGPPPGTLTDLPVWIQKRISALTRESFDQNYWREMTETAKYDIEAILDVGGQDGASIADMAAEIREALGTEYYHSRARNIARTESCNALNGARRESIDGLREIMGPDVPMEMEWLSVLAETTRDTHALLDGTPADKDGLWDLAGYLVPWPGHFSLPAGERCNCFPSGTLVSGAFTGAQRCWYEGIIAEIVLQDGRCISMTPNHPVVTANGLVGAGMLKPGDKVMSYNGQANSFISPPSSTNKSFTVRVLDQSLGFAGGNNIQNKPAKIEQIFETMSHRTSSTPRPIEFRSPSARDFYGDGVSIKGNIEIVRPDWELLDNIKIGQSAKRGDAIFPGMVNIATVSKLGNSHSGPTFRTMGPTSTSRPGFTENFLDIFGRFLLSPSTQLRIGPAAYFDARLDKSADKQGAVISSFLRDAKQRFSALISFDNVVEVRYRYASGHVYDLQSSYGLIVAYDNKHDSYNGIVTKNCLCTLGVAFGMEGDEAAELIAEYEQRVQDYEGEDEAAYRVRIKQRNDACQTP